MADPTRDLSAPTADPAPAGDTPSASDRTDGLPAAPAPPAPPVAPPGYELRDEVGSGGMGVVYRARDLRLNRDVAVKVLHDKYAPTSLAARRFIDESQITGQLQHPGIPPVHEVGTLPDGRPFLVMKLIKGRTLAELLAGGSANRGSLIAAFEQVCQAVAYAHNHGVIHRDLKPHNVMVGQFGEVQVMDWGLAKLRTDARSETPETEAVTTFHDPRDDADEGLQTRAGSFLGTPAYMPPEQALGAVDQIDERSDVFGLGAILCVILTGQPPFVANTREATRQMAGEKKLAPAFTRLDASGAEAELVALCKRCLSPEKPDRPKNAGEVATAVHAFRVEAEERARQAELERVRAEGERAKAEVQASEQRKRRRVQLALAAAVLVLVAGSGAFAWWSDRQAQGKRELQVRNGEAIETLLAQCEEHLRNDDADRAGITLEQAQKRSAEGGGDHLAERLDRCRADLAILRDLDRINDLRWAVTEGGIIGAEKMVAERREAFTRFGIVLGITPTEEAARRMSDSLVKERLLTAFDEWLGNLLYLSLIPPATDPDRVSREAIGTELLAILRAVDPHPFRMRIREASLASFTQPEGYKRLTELRDSPEAMEQPPWFAVTLQGISQKQILQNIVRRQPRHFTVLMTLGRLSPPQEAERWYRAALAIRPNNPVAWCKLGDMLQVQDDPDGALTSFREAVRLSPRYAEAQSGLGFMLQRKGDLDAAVTAFKEAIAAEPKSTTALEGLGLVLWDMGDLDGALHTFRNAEATLPLPPQLPPGWPPAEGAFAGQLRFLNRQKELRPRLAQIADGQAEPTSLEETAQFARLCSEPFERRYALATRLYAAAFADLKATNVDFIYDVRLMYQCEGRRYGRGGFGPPGRTMHRYNAIRCAALAAAGKDVVMTGVGIEEWGYLTDLAYNWLQSVLDDQSTSRYMLTHWQRDPDFVAIRDPAWLAAMPPSDQKRWQALWLKLRIRLQR